MLIGILLLSLAGFYVVENVIENSNDGGSEVVKSEEVELTVPEKILAEAKKFEETGEGKNLPGMVSALSDYEFEEACDWATEDCIEMCEGLDDWRCESICYGDFYTNDPCRDWLLKEIEDVGFLDAINEGYFSRSFLAMPEHFVKIGEGHPHPKIHDDFFKEVADYSRGDGDRMTILRDSHALGISMQENGLVMSDVKEFYAAFEPFQDTEFLTDLVILTKDDEIYWMSTPIPEVRETRDHVLQRVL